MTLRIHPKGWFFFSIQNWLFKFEMCVCVLLIWPNRFRQVSAGVFANLLVTCHATPRCGVYNCLLAPCDGFLHYKIRRCRNVVFYLTFFVELLYLGGLYIYIYIGLDIKDICTHLKQRQPGTCFRPWPWTVKANYSGTVVVCM